MDFVIMKFWTLILLFWADLAASSAITNDTTLDRLASRQNPPERLFANWSFKQFENTDLLNAVKYGLVDAFTLAEFAWQNLDCSPPPPSFNRYFQTQYIDRVRGVYQTVMAERNPTTGHRVRVYYNDNPAPGWPRQCTESSVGTYMTSTRDKDNHFNGFFIYICPRVFTVFPADLDDRSCEDLLPHATEKSMVTIGSLILHEMLHSLAAGKVAEAPNDLINDVVIEWPNSRTGHVQAYGPFFSYHLNVSPDIPSQTATWNVENYVYFALETYFAERCGLDGFENPPDDSDTTIRATDVTPPQESDQ